MPFAIYVFLAVLFCPSFAWAYLDPGTGNILVYLIVSLIGAAGFFLKNLFYRLKARLGYSPTSLSINDDVHKRIAIFNEGRMYWGTFKPIVESLVARGQDFSYMSMDMADPGLAIDNPHMNARFIGEGSSAYAKVAGFRARVMLATTPNIGTPGFPLPAPRNVRCLAHVFHGVGGLGQYMKHSLDSYHAVLMMGPFMEAEVRHLEKLRGLPAKECVLAGLPYLDTLAAKVAPKEGVSEPSVILAAPSWGDKGFLTMCGTGFLLDLAGKGYQLIIRPHPQSLKVEQELLARVRAEMAPFKSVAFDLEPDGSASMAKADVLISDMSGVRFDFALLYGRPVITIDAPFRNAGQYEMADLEAFWDRDVSSEIGAVLKPDELGSMDEALKALLSSRGPNLAAFREKNVANFGRSGEFIANWLIDKAAEE